MIAFFMKFQEHHDTRYTFSKYRFWNIYCVQVVEIDWALKSLDGQLKKSYLTKYQNDMTSYMMINCY